MSSFDYRLFQAINGLAGHSGFWDGLMKFLSSDGEYLFYLGVLVYWFTRSGHNRRMVLEALASACVALGISAVLSRLFYRDRPFVAHQVHQLIPHAANASFPSDHATAAFVIATAIWYNRRKDGWGWLLAASGIAFSRIWTGVHYPLDVVSGMLLGIASAAVIHAAFRKSSLLRNVMNGGIGLYERVEHKIWPLKQNGQKEEAK